MIYSNLSVQKMNNDFELLFNMYNYIFVPVVVPRHLELEIKEDLIPRWIEEKLKEPQFKYDRDDLEKRGWTGFGGEGADEILFRVPILDRDEKGRLVVGKSTKFGADFSKVGLDIGIKTCDRPNFPVVKTKVRRPQVINIKVEDNLFLVGGFASMKTLRDFQSSNYIKNDNLRNKTNRDGSIAKRAFYGLHDLKSVYTFEELKNLYNKYKNG
jgi:hypothetical protein